jgi:hypothetical protein
MWNVKIYIMLTKPGHNISGLAHKLTGPDVESPVVQVIHGFIHSCCQFLSPPLLYFATITATFLAFITVAIFGFTAVPFANFLQSHCTLTATYQRLPPPVSFLLEILSVTLLSCFLLADWTHFWFSMLTLDCHCFPFCSRFTCQSLLGMDHQMDNRCLGGFLD